MSSRKRPPQGPSTPQPPQAKNGSRRQAPANSRPGQRPYSSAPSARPTPPLQAVAPKRKVSLLGRLRQASQWTQAQLRPLKEAPPDWSLLGIALALLSFGLISVYSASAKQALEDSGSLYALVGKQGLFAILGLGSLWALMQVPYQRYRRWARPAALGVIALLVLTALVGDTANGSERWLRLGPFRFQPSELAKLAVVLLMAQGLSQKDHLQAQLTHSRLLPLQVLWQSWKPVALSIGLAGLMIVLILGQPNLSVALILGFVSVLMTFLGGLSLWFIPCGLVPTLLMGYFKLQQSGNYQWKRIQGWLDPWADPQNAGYNLIQSYYAIGSGGLWGRGFGQSVQKHYYLPFQHTDFIFAVICEELGLFGSTLVLGLFIALGYRGYRIALNCNNTFGKLLAFGLTTLIITQATINLCVTTGLFPVTGVTLPLISYGGTSLVVTLAMVGILLNISRDAEPKSGRSSPSAPPSPGARSLPAQGYGITTRTAVEGV